MQLYNFFNRTQVLIDDRRLFGAFNVLGRFDFSNDWSSFYSDNLWSVGSGFFSFFQQTLGFTLATTHFARIVRRAASAADGKSRCFFNDGFNHCFRCWFGFDFRSRRHGCRLFDDGRFSDDRCSRCFGRQFWRLSCLNLFLNRRRRCFVVRRCLLDNRCAEQLSLSGCWLFNRCCEFFAGYYSLDFNVRSGFCCSRCNVYGLRFNHWGLDGWRFGCFYSGSGTFSLTVCIGFGRCTDHAAGNGGSDCQTGSQIRSGFFAGAFFSAFRTFRTFDHIAVGITLTLATVAATTLAT